MIYDIHAHVADLGSNSLNDLCRSGRSNIILRILLERVLSLASPSDEASTRRLLVQWIDESLIDRVVLLAMDGAYRSDGAADHARTRMTTGNDFVSSFLNSPKVLFGASIHPNRPDALRELDRVVEKGACLIKWLPSAQNIAPDDQSCVPFYERMAHYKIPLLTHTGVEHTLPEFRNSLNDPRRLVTALKQGVTVIAAHCGTRMFLHEKSYFREWTQMAREHPLFYGDLSAFALPVHGAPLRAIIRDPQLLEKAVYGSDFPAITLPLWYLFRIGWRRTMELRRVKNPLDAPYLTMKAMGVPERVFEKAGQLLLLKKAVNRVERGTVEDRCMAPAVAD